VLGVADGGDRDRARSAVERSTCVIAEHYPAERPVAARADDKQISLLDFSLFVKTRARAARLDADQLGFDLCCVTLPLEYLLGFLTRSHWDPRCQRASSRQLTASDMSERELSSSIDETRGKCDRVAAVGPAVYSHEHILEHHDSSNGLTTMVILGRHQALGRGALTAILLLRRAGSPHVRDRCDLPSTPTSTFLNMVVSFGSLVAGVTGRLVS
jgi:hypothetical protein